MQFLQVVRRVRLSLDKPLIAATGLAGLTLLSASASATSIPVTTPGFESPTVTVDTYTVTFGSLATNAVPGWTFGTSAGASYDGLVVNGGNLGAGSIPEGTQAAFLQGTGTISQVLSGFTAGSYTVSFKAAGRNGGLGPDPLSVTFDGTPVTFSGSPTASPTISPAWQSFTSDPISLAAGSHTLAFTGTVPFGGGLDRTTFVDTVSVSSTPEPATLGFLGLGMTGLLARRKRG